MRAVYCNMMLLKDRATAEDLCEHVFTKIYEADDDNHANSLPLFASVSDMGKSLVRKDSGKY